ncbi:MAG: polysaccharide pyruvyl transferase CsaB [Armatimonadetes bacterium]|nr:polysaccharide pyruvyl transferase CsaB [Armatimonadota bacterium]MDW8028201.1 polysaccharide pyruvyl transferase CsaB [Armatimonadota bacterium]
MSHLLLFGYFGAGNFGDEWTLAAFLKGLRQIGLKSQKVFVISRDKERTEAEHGVKAITRNWRSIFSKLSDCQYLVGCGGSLLQDVTSFRSLTFYCLLIWSAKLKGKKVALLGQGLGPLKRQLSKLLAKRVINACDLVTFREQDSFHFAQKIGCDIENCFVTSDITFAWDEFPNLKPTSSIAVNLRPVKERWERENVVKALKRIVREGEEILLLPLQPNLDEIALQPLSKIPSSKWHRYKTWRDGLVGIASCNFLLAMRLHALIAACMLAVPFVGLNYDPKVANILGKIEGKQILPLSASESEISSAIEIVRSQVKNLAERFHQFVSTQKVAALQNFELLAEKLLN